MHAAPVPYDSRLLEGCWEQPPARCRNATPLEDFGGVTPIPNLTCPIRTGRGCCSNGDRLRFGPPAEANAMQHGSWPSVVSLTPADQAWRTQPPMPIWRRAIPAALRGGAARCHERRCGCWVAKELAFLVMSPPRAGSSFGNSALMRPHHLLRPRRRLRHRQRPYPRKRGLWPCCSGCRSGGAPLSVAELDGHRALETASAPLLLTP